MDDEALIVSAMLAMAISVLNGIAHYRSRTKQTAPRRTRRRAPEAIDEMDARTVLDIDARLEALERRERQMADAEHIQRLADKGQQSAPAEPLAEDSVHVGIQERA